MSSPFSKRLWPVVVCAVFVVAGLLWWQSRSKPQPAAPKVIVHPPVAPAPAPAPTPAQPSPPSDPNDPRTQIDAALADPDPRIRAQQFSLLMVQWIARDADGAVGYVRKMPRGPERSQALFMLLDNISRRDFARGLTLARELLTSREDRYLYSSLFDRLARENLAQARDFVNQVPAGDGRENALRAVVEVWVRQDSAAALAWAEKLPAGRDRNTALESVLRELSERDPRAAVERAQALLTGQALERTLSQALAQLTVVDPQAASELVLRLPPGDLQTNAVTNVARAMAMQNVDTALAWVKSLKIELTQWYAMNSVLTAWWQKDPSAAARYVLDMPSGGGLDIAAQHMAALLSSNPQNAIAWAEALESDSARETALVTVASSWAQRAPAEAVRWAADLKSEPLRTNATTGAFTYWQMQDAAAAQEWLEKAPFPPDAKSRMMRAGSILP